MPLPIGPTPAATLFCCGWRVVEAGQRQGLSHSSILATVVEIEDDVAPEAVRLCGPSAGCAKSRCKSQECRKRTYPRSMLHGSTLQGIRCTL